MGPRSFPGTAVVCVTRFKQESVLVVCVLVLDVHVLEVDVRVAVVLEVVVMVVRVWVVEMVDRVVVTHK